MVRDTRVGICLVSLSCRAVRIHSQGSTLVISSNPNPLPKAPPLNTKSDSGPTLLIPHSGDSISTGLWENKPDSDHTPYFHFPCKVFLQSFIKKGYTQKSWGDIRICTHHFGTPTQRRTSVLAKGARAGGAV